MVGEDGAVPAPETPDVVWSEWRLRIPAERYQEARQLLGHLVTAYGAELQPLAATQAMEEQPVTYNERKVVWVDEASGTGLRPVVPFERILEQDYPYGQQRLVASRLVEAISRAARAALQQDEPSYLLDFVYAEPSPDDQGHYDIRGLYADKVQELAHGGVVLGAVHGVGWVSVALLRGFCADLVEPARPTE
jgi:hypothetical protein